MNMRDSSKGNKGGAVMCVGGGPCAGSGGVSEENCCRHPGTKQK